MKTDKNICSLVLLTFLFVATCQGAVSASLLWSQKAEASCTAQTSFQQCVLCDLHPKEVTLHVLNTLIVPYMDESLTLTCTSQIFLLGMMQEAATQDTSFRFSGTYFNLNLGWFVDAYNGTYASSEDQTYWEILDGNMRPTPVGVSYYQPKNGETVTFNLTNYS
ncbi:cobalamin binding intrinsic factor-like [Littorina saxatilis]|uniref:DUF4430 domain-containing protein n=1 Tax=Littorina saxatilis TaxID=31220 RepID=A0AAN9AUV9_9CAEN